TALRVVGKQKGAEVLNRVVEVRGRSGMPQPAVWKVILLEPNARGGVRELEVQNGRIISERTPTSARELGAPMDFNRLNLDSEGLFTIVNQEAQTDRIPFDRLDYALRTGTDGRLPVWTVDLYDGRASVVASVKVAADTGNVLGKAGMRAGPRVAEGDNDRDYVRPPPRPIPNDEREYPGRVYEEEEIVEERWSEPGQPFSSVADFFQRLGRRVERRGKQLERFFSGREDERR
ncbi:MAG: hypothetical protein M3463_08740, partial [Verrucomicrobiota bacterium]|nr:hypothetical protein [Verrucomicrobiota bacterium]